MGLKRAFPIAVMFGILAIFFYEWSNPRSELFRYKLTINVRVDGKPYSASSVIEARQSLGVCLFGNARCLPNFTAKGVAPMIMLPDGAVIFASLSGNHQHDKNSPLQGWPVTRLPWIIYLDRRPKGNTLARLPDQTPRMEIPFEGHPKSNRKPTTWYAPPQKLGPPLGYIIGPGKTQPTGRAIRFDTFVIEPTDEPLVEWLDPAPPWMAAHRGGPRISEIERKERIRRIVQERATFDSVARANVETSKRMLSQ